VQFFSVNDLIENQAPASTWATVKDGWLTHRDGQEDADEALPLTARVQLWVKSNSHVAVLLLDSAGYLATRLGVLGKIDAFWGEDFEEEAAGLGSDLLVQIAEYAHQIGAETLLFYGTGQAQVIVDTYKKPRSAAVVEQASERAEVPWVDASRLLQLRSDRQDLYFPKDGHWTPAGHRAVAEILTDEIVSLGLIRNPNQAEHQTR
jgi:hypothetical protein